MATMESKNEMLVMVVTDLAAICKKLAEHPALPENLRRQAREFGEEFDSLLAYAGKGTATQHFQGEALLTRMARFLPGVLNVKAETTTASQKSA